MSIKILPFVNTVDLLARIAKFLNEKIISAQVGSISMIEELQKTNSRLEQEIEVLRRSAQFSMGTTSLTSVIEAQERKIKALELAQNVSISYLQ